MIGDESLRRGMARRLLRRTVASGQLRLPAVPALLDEYQATCLKTFATLGVEFSAEQTARLREVLAAQLAKAFAASPRAEIVIAYDAPVGL
ncbi:MAG: SAM-dependent methyltransferase, partial [Planctomycetia bacterium]